MEHQKHTPDAINVAAEPSEEKVTVRLAPGDNIEWQSLIEEALTAPAHMSAIYSRFYNYSINNQLLLLMQGTLEPVATYKRWQELDRHVRKGSKAKSILRPIFYKEKKENGEDEQKLKGFKMVKCIFGYSDTEGEELPPYEPPEWSAERALGALAINREAFQSLDGNTQGYSYDHQLAINPVAAYPLKTLAHEMGHIVLGHTTPDQLSEYQKHQGVKEFQAEATAYIVMNDLGVDDQWDQAGSRGYIQSWLKGQTPSDNDIKPIFRAVDRILKAGRPSDG